MYQCILICRLPIGLFWQRLWLLSQPDCATAGVPARFLHHHVLPQPAAAVLAAAVPRLHRHLAQAIAQLTQRRRPTATEAPAAAVPQDHGLVGPAVVGPRRGVAAVAHSAAAAASHADELFETFKHYHEAVTVHLTFLSYLFDGVCVSSGVFFIWGSCDTNLVPGTKWWQDDDQTNTWVRKIAHLIFCFSKHTKHGSLLLLHKEEKSIENSTEKRKFAHFVRHAILFAACRVQVW